jgi:hypothetical protein
MPAAFDCKNCFRLVKMCTYKPIIIYSNAIRACGHKVFPEDSDSFIPSTIRQWNSLDSSLRNVDSIAKFKAAVFEFSAMPTAFDCKNCFRLV